MFKTFPEFSKLTLADRDEYNNLIKDYPPYSEFSFVTVMTWWNVLNTAAVALLNDNIVLSYWLPGDEDNSGLSLVGTNKIDESICQIFDHLKERGQVPKLVHVPEFVINCIRYSNLFRFIGERDYDEYVLRIEDLHPLSNTTGALKLKIERFSLQNRGQKINTNPFDLNLWENRQLLLQHAKEWSQANRTQREYPKAVQDSRKEILMNADILGMEGIGIYRGSEMCGFFLYRIHETWAISSYLDFDASIAGMNEFLLYACSGDLAKKGVQFINIDCDLGDHTFRGYGLPLGPANFSRKYTILPS